MTDWATEDLGFFVRIVTQQIAPAAFPDETFSHYSLPAFDATGGPLAQEGRSIESGKFLLGQPAVLVSKLNPRKMRVQTFGAAGGRRAVASTEFMVYVPRVDGLDLHYLKHLLSSTRFAQRLQAVATGTTNSHVRVKPSETLRWPVRVPPLEEQRRIAGILDTIDELIQATERVVSKLTCANEGVISTAIEAAALTGHQSTVEREFEIETGIALNASRVPRSNPVGYLRVANVQRSEIDTSDIATMEATEDEVRRKALAVGDLLVVEGHASPNEIGRCAVAPRSAEGLLFQNHLFRLRPSAMPSDLARMILNSAEAKAYWRRVCATSSGLHTINSSMLRAMPISVPRRDHQRVLSALIVACDSSVSTEQQELRRLRELRSGLAADLLSGRVRTVAA